MKGKRLNFNRIISKPISSNWDSIALSARQTGIENEISNSFTTVFVPVYESEKSLFWNLSHQRRRSPLCWGAIEGFRLYCFKVKYPLIKMFPTLKAHTSIILISTSYKYHNSNSLYLLQFTGLHSKLPPNVHLLTFEAVPGEPVVASPAGTVPYMLRLEHFYETGEDATLSKPVTFDLKVSLAGPVL